MRKLVAAAVVLVLAAGCSADTGGSYTPTSKAVSTSRAASLPQVTYRVSGTAARASLTYQNDMGGTEQHEVAVPWTKTYWGFQSDYDFLYVSAQNMGAAGTLRCEVLVGGDVLFRSDASGAYAICTASGSYGDR